MNTDWSHLANAPEIRSRRGAETRQRLILAAADLFADRGIDAVAPHEILEAAGQRNASAIQYHFGSREGLIVAVLQPRPDIRGPIDEERTRLLDRLLSGGAPLALEGAVAAWILPASLTLESKPGRSFVRVAAQVIRTLPLEHRVVPSQPSERRAHGTVLRLLGDLPAAIAAERLGAAFTLYMELLANRARQIDDELVPNLPLPQFKAELVAMLMGLLAAPARTVGSEAEA